MAIDTAVGAFLRTGPTDFTLGASASNPSNALFLEWLQPPVRDVVNNQTFLLSRIYRNATGMKEMGGKYSRLPLNVINSQGHGHVGEDATLPDSNPPTFTEAHFKAEYHYGRIKFTGPARAASATQRGAFLESAAAQTTSVAQGMGVELNSVFCLDGAGVFCTVSANVVASTTFVAANPGGFTNPGPGSQYLKRGMLISFVRAGALVAGPQIGRITAIDYSSHTVTLDTAVTVNAADLVVKISAPALTDLNSTGYLRTPFGLKAIIEEANPFGRNFGELDRSVLPEWRSWVDSANGQVRPFTPMMLQRLMDGVAQWGDGNLSEFWMSYGLRRSFLANVIANQRFAAPRQMELATGFSTISWDDRPLIPEKMLPRGHVFGLDWRCIFLGTMGGDYQFLTDGNVLSRIPNKDSFEATAFRYHQLMCDAPNKLGLIKDLEDA